MLRATGVVFFAYIGFDAVSTAAQEARNLQKDMPWGILGSLVVSTILYILVTLVMARLPVDTWIRLFVWMLIGFVIYAFYGKKHSKVRVH